MNNFALRDAIASVALSHPDKHDCIVCRCVNGTATPEEYAQVVWAMTWAMPQKENA